MNAANIGKLRALSLEERSRDRRRHLVANRAAGFAEADAWDLEFWQACTPEERLSALIAIKSAIDDPRHEEDARVLMAVRDRKRRED